MYHLIYLCRLGGGSVSSFDGTYELVQKIGERPFGCRAGVFVCLKLIEILWTWYSCDLK